MSDVKEIFRLRREGQLNEALDQARSLYSLIPDDEWAVKALGWVLYDKLKNALAENNQEEIDLFSEELTALNIGQDDEMLYNSISRLLAQQNPANRLLAEARRNDFEGNHELALNTFRQIKGQFADDDISFNNAYGWCIYKYLKNLVKNQAADTNTYRQLIDEYFTLKPEKPSVLHSMMLMLAVQHFKDNTQAILKWQVNFTSGDFRNEDFEPYEREGKKYPGLAERAVQAIAKTLLSEGDQRQIEQFGPTLDSAIEKFPDNIWFYYFKAKMLIRIGKKTEAKAFILPVVRRKQTEYWAWALLADVLGNESTEKAISCYSKTLLCKAEEKFLINTRLSFGLLLKSAGYHSEARTEFAKSIQSRIENGYNIPANLMTIEKEEWYQKTEANADNKTFYRAHIGGAMALVYGELPRLNGNIISTFTREDDPKKQLRARLLIAETDGIHFMVNVRVSTFPVLKNLAPGSAISALIDRSEKQPVIAIDLRKSDELFDQAKRVIGVVDHVNREKNITHIALSRDTGVLLKSSSTYSTGSFVELRVLEQQRNGTPYVEVLNHKPTMQMPSPQFCQPFSGTVSLNPAQTHGRIGDVQIGKQLIEKNHLNRHQGKTLTGIAVKTINTSRQQYEWRAITIDMVNA